MASDNEGTLRLSTTANAWDTTTIASLAGYTSPQQWTKYGSQQSVTISLLAGKRYYIEALHKEATVVGDNLAVGWRPPLMAPTATPVVIPGSALSPYSAPGARLIFEKMSGEMELSASSLLTAYPNPTASTTTIEFTTLESGWLGVQLYNLQGQPLKQVFGQEVEAGSVHQQQLDGRALPAGLYLLRMVNGKQVQQQKLIITR